MIITLRGTNGAGKSTVVRKIMEDYETVITMAYPEKNKRKPMGYICSHGLHKLFVPGHYEIANGGVDTLPDLEYAYKLIYEHHALAADVLFEGKNFNDSPQRILSMKRGGLDVRVIQLNPTLKECIASVRQRGHKIKEDTIKRLYVKTWDELKIFQKHGITCVALNRQEAVDQIRQWLAITSGPAHTKS